MRAYEDRRIFDWLSQLDYSAYQDQNAAKRQPGTCLWLLESSQYQAWTEGENKSMFCPGMPGAGKTVCSSAVVADLQKRFKSTPNTRIAYVYLSYQRQSQQSLRNLAASLLKQLVQGHPLPAEVRELYHQSAHGQNQPCLEDCVKVLHSTARDIEKLYIVIDALDECRKAVVESFLTEIAKLDAPYGVNLFATSRFFPDIASGFDNSIRLDIRAAEEDVRLYVESRLPQLQAFVARDTVLRNQIRDAVTEAVDGM